MRTRRGAAIVIAAATCCGLGMNSASAAGDALALLTPHEAAQIIDEVDAKAVSPSAPQTQDGTVFEPSLVQGATGFKSIDTAIPSRIPTDPEAPITIGSGASAVQLTPLGVDATATNGAVINGDSVVYANTDRDADTVVRPLVNGIETFTSIRSAAAPEAYAWKVSLHGDEQLRKQPDGSVQVIDPTPALSNERGPDGAGSDAGRAALADQSKQPDPDAATKADRAAQTVRPADALAAAPDAALVPSPSSGQLAEDDLRDSSTLAALAKEAARAGASEDLATARRAADARDAEIRDAERQIVDGLEEMADTPVVVAEFKPPVSIDADGASVPTTLEVSGDVVSLRVDHRGEDVAYPISADPVVEIYRLEQVTRYYPVYRTETRLSHYENAYAYVSSFPSAHLGYLNPRQSLGGGWWAYWANGQQLAVYAPAGGTAYLYTVYQKPVYVQAQVLANWASYQTIEWVTYVEWMADDWVTYNAATDSFWATTYGQPPVAFAAAKGKKPNGCGPGGYLGIGGFVVPERVSGVYDFHRECNGHDNCYAAQRGRTFCDKGFLKAMRRECSGKFLTAPLCLSAAEVYYQAVRTFGEGAYIGAGR